jgi:hypothetical protein
MNSINFILQLNFYLKVQPDLKINIVFALPEPIIQDEQIDPFWFGQT